MAHPYDSGNEQFFALINRNTYGRRKKDCRYPDETLSFKKVKSIIAYKNKFDILCCFKAALIIYFKKEEFLS